MPISLKAVTNLFDGGKRRQELTRARGAAVHLLSAERQDALLLRNLLHLRHKGSIIPLATIHLLGGGVIRVAAIGKRGHVTVVAAKATPVQREAGSRTPLVEVGRVRIVEVDCLRFQMRLMTMSRPRTRLWVLQVQ